MEVNRPSRRPDEQGGLEIEGVHWGLVDGSGWVRVERLVRQEKVRNYFLSKPLTIIPVK